MISCPFCGAQIAPGSSFCTSCGQKLPDLKTGAAPKPENRTDAFLAQKQQMNHPDPAPMQQEPMMAQPGFEQPAPQSNGFASTQGFEQPAPQPNGFVPQQEFEQPAPVQDNPVFAPIPPQNNPYVQNTAYAPQPKQPISNRSLPTDTQAAQIDWVNLQPRSHRVGGRAVVFGIFAIVLVFALCLFGSFWMFVTEGSTDGPSDQPSKTELKPDQVPVAVIDALNIDATREEYYGNYKGTWTMRVSGLDKMSELTGMPEDMAKTLTSIGDKSYDCTAVYGEEDFRVICPSYPVKGNGDVIYQISTYLSLENGKDEMSDSDGEDPYSYTARKTLYHLNGGKLYVLYYVILEENGEVIAYESVRGEFTKQ